MEIPFTCTGKSGCGGYLYGLALILLQLKQSLTIFLTAFFKPGPCIINLTLFNVELDCAWLLHLCRCVRYAFVKQCFGSTKTGVMENFCKSLYCTLLWHLMSSSLSKYNLNVAYLPNSTLSPLSRVSNSLLKHCF